MRPKLVNSGGLCLLWERPAAPFPPGCRAPARQGLLWVAGKISQVSSSAFNLEPLGVFTLLKNGISCPFVQERNSRFRINLGSASTAIS